MSDLDSRIGQRAIARGWITAAQLETALDAQTVEIRNRRYLRLGEVLVATKLLRPAQVAELLGEQQVVIARAQGSNFQYNIVDRDPERLYHCPKDGMQLEPLVPGNVVNVRVRGVLHRRMGIVPGEQVAAPAAVTPAAGAPAPAPAVQVAPTSAPGGVAQRKAMAGGGGGPINDVNVAARSGPLPAVGAVPARSNGSTTLPSVGSGGSAARANPQSPPTASGAPAAGRPAPPPRAFPQHLHARPASRDGKSSAAQARNARPSPPNPLGASARTSSASPPPPPSRHAMPKPRTASADSFADGLSPAQMPSLGSAGWEGAEVDDNGQVTLPESFMAGTGDFGDYPSEEEVPVEIVGDSSTISPTLVDEEDVDVSNLRISKPSMPAVGDTPTTPGADTGKTAGWPSRHSTPAQVDLSIPDPQGEFMYDADVDPWGEPEQDFPRWPTEGGGDGQDGPTTDDEWDKM